MRIWRLIFAELVQARARVDVQLFTVAGSGSLCEPRTSRKTIALFTLFNRLQLRRLRRRETTCCHVIHVVLVPVPHSHSKRHQALLRASRRSRRKSWMCQCCGTHWITQDALLDMIDAIDTDMHEQSRTRSAARWPNTSPSSSWKSSPTSNVSIWTPTHRCSDSCCSHSCTLQHRTQTARNIELLAGASSIGSVEQRELLAEAKRLLETGELFPRGTAEEPHAPDAEAEASDSEPEAHVMEPLADDHSSDGEDTPTGFEESAAPAAPAVAAAPERAAMGLLEQSVSCTVANHHHDSTLPLCRSQNELGVSSAHVHVRVSRVVVVCCCFTVHPFYLCRCCVHSSRFSPVPSLALRMGSNDQCGNQCCPSFGGCLCRHHPKVETAAHCASTREKSPSSDRVSIDRLIALS